jgi:hypothetical protein
MAKQATNKPTATYRMGSISLSLFENNRKFENTSYISRNYVCQKSYKDEKGTFHNIDSFTLPDLIHLRHLITCAITDGMISVD